MMAFFGRVGISEREGAAGDNEGTVARRAGSGGADIDTALDGQAAALDIKGAAVGGLADGEGLEGAVRERDIAGVEVKHAGAGAGADVEPAGRKALRIAGDPGRGTGSAHVDDAAGGKAGRGEMIEQLRVVGTVEQMGRGRAGREDAEEEGGNDEGWDGFGFHNDWYFDVGLGWKSPRRRHGGGPRALLQKHAVAEIFAEDLVFDVVE